MLEYEFERVDCTGSGGYSFLGGVGLATVGHQEIIRKRAADGWRFAGWIPATQRAGGFIETIDLGKGVNMEQKQIDRINELAKKAKSPEGLTEWEEMERAALRREYIDSVLGNLKGQLDNTYIVDEKGNKIKLQKKGEK